MEYGADYRVRSLIHADLAYSFEYSRDGRPSRIVETSSGDARDRRFDYDAQGRLEAVSSNRPEDDRAVEYGSNRVVLTTPLGKLAFGYSDRREITYAAAEDARIGVDYDESGALKEIHGDTGSVRFERDAVGASPRRDTRTALSTATATTRWATAVRSPTERAGA